MEPQICIILTGDRSDWLLYRVLRSIERLRQSAAEAQITTELIVVLNRPRPAALEAVRLWQREWSLDELVVVDSATASGGLKDGLKLARGRYVLVHDDRGYSSANWLVAAHYSIEQDAPRAIIHPQYHFDFTTRVWRQFSDQQGGDFDVRTLLLADYYSGPILVERAYLEQWPLPFSTADSIARGYTYFVAPETVYYQLQPTLPKQPGNRREWPSAFFNDERIFGVATGKQLVGAEAAASQLSPLTLEPEAARLIATDATDLSPVEPRVLTWQELTYQPPQPQPAVVAALADVYGWLINRWLPSANISHVFLLNWLTTGGADREVLAYIDALANDYCQRVAVITTEPAVNEWRYLLPESVLFIDLGDQLKDLDVETVPVSTTLARLLIQRRPAVIHLVGSRLGWQTLAAAGRALARHSQIFITAFSDKYDANGYPNGRLTTYLPAVRPYLSGIITDNEQYRQWCGRHYALSPERVHCVYPPQELLSAETDYRAKQVLWAGRLDAGKRLDILLAIATKLSDYNFFVYGQPVLDDAAEQLAVLRQRPNIHLTGMYRNFREVLVRPYSLLLYTTDRDGLPNVILEAMAAKIPVVAPNVGGITELITAATGFLVDDYQNVAAYCQQIRAVGGNSPLTQQRVNRAYRLIKARHSRAGFVAALADLPGYVK